VDHAWGANKQCTCTPQPHKHAAVIKAWADGAKLQWKDDNGHWNDTNQPAFYDHWEYRVKPEPKPYGKVLSDAWYSVSYTSMATADRWQTAAEVVIAAYKERGE
jgi:hypothetical protein